jgi:hypothetical protein
MLEWISGPISNIRLSTFESLYPFLDSSLASRIFAIATCNLPVTFKLSRHVTAKIEYWAAAVI